MTKREHILVTGVAGFLGSNLLTKLLQEGHQVTGIDNLSMGQLSNIAAHLDNPDFTFLEKDIVEESTFEELDDTFDKIVHLAAFKIPVHFAGHVGQLSVFVLEKGDRAPIQSQQKVMPAIVIKVCPDRGVN